MVRPVLSVVSHDPALGASLEPGAAARGFRVRLLAVPVDGGAEAIEQACARMSTVLIGLALSCVTDPSRLASLADGLRADRRALLVVPLGLSAEELQVLRALARQHPLGLAGDLDALLDAAAIVGRGGLPKGDRVAIVATTDALAHGLERRARQSGLVLEAPRRARGGLRVVVDPAGRAGAAGACDIVGLAAPQRSASTKQKRGLVVVQAQVPAVPGARGTVVQGGDRLIEVLSALQGLAPRRSHGARSARPSGTDRAAAHALIDGPRRILSEPSSKRALAPYGIPFGREVLSKSASMAEHSARSMHPPLVAKIASPDLLDKLDGHGIVRAIPNAQQVRAAYHTLTRAALETKADARILGVLLSETVVGIAEVRLCIARHPRLGLLLALGGSGAHRLTLPPDPLLLLPAGRADVEQLVQDAPVTRLFDGAEGRPVGDRKALAELIVRAACFALDFRDEVSEVLLDPIVIRPRGEGVVATDARVSVG